ncbi:MAG TPA: acyl carrier protein [Actinophytocola sp.]|uniref:acyl carrier protein n=1 Tax=Actinophytocola sp. TaxID=1872138 RepID=UPI002DDD91B3|nr:acyl carrier protein [Actinophytocola sp.]HEV2779522.1 acyl carrier protein [Actinophytocola sp.]
MSDAARAELRQFITAKYPAIELTDDQDIFGLGFVNSLFAMELVMFIEKTFGARIPNDELKLDHFRSVNAMVALVQRLAGPTAQASGV